MADLTGRRTRVHRGTMAKIQFQRGKLWRKNCQSLFFVNSTASKRCTEPRLINFREEKYARTISQIRRSLIHGNGFLMGVYVRPGINLNLGCHRPDLSLFRYLASSDK